MAAEPASVDARCGHVDCHSSRTSWDDGAGIDGIIVGVADAAWHGGGDDWWCGGRWLRGVWLCLCLCIWLCLCSRLESVLYGYGYACIYMRGWPKLASVPCTL